MRRTITFALSVLCVAAAYLITTGYPVTILDDRGVEITLSSMPKRIITVTALYAQIVIDLGAIDRLVAMADSPNNPLSAASLPSVGPTYAPSVETIIALEPSLVLGATDWGGERAALENSGITVLTLPILSSVADVLAAIRSIGHAIGANTEAVILVDRIVDDIARTESRVLGRTPVRAAFLYPPSLGVGPYVAGSDCIESELISRAGGINVFADVKGFPQVNIEDVLLRNPDVIFTDPAQISFITDDPLLSFVSAVASGRVIAISASAAASTQVADVLAAMAAALHPE